MHIAATTFLLELQKNIVGAGNNYYFNNINHVFSLSVEKANETLILTV